MIHIHSPQPTNIKDCAIYESDPQIAKGRFGQLVFYINGCCRKNRLAHNCNILFYEWYEPLVVCKEGKGCKQ
jgi:hypothetical protein